MKHPLSRVNTYFQILQALRKSLCEPGGVHITTLTVNIWLGSWLHMVSKSQVGLES